MTKHVKLTDLIERISTVETEMRSIYDAAETAGADLTGENLEKWTALQAERDDLKGKESRARQRDELDRKSAGGTSVEHRGENAGDAWALTKEQRMSDYVASRSGAKVEPLSIGRLVGAMMKGERLGDLIGGGNAIGATPSRRNALWAPASIRRAGFSYPT